MKASKETKSATQVTVKVALPAEVVRRKLDELFLQASHEIELPGFRRGHIPRAVLEARFGRDFLNEEAQDELIREYLPQALRELGLRPVSPPQTKPLEFAAQKDFVFEAEVEILPEVTVQNYTGLEIEDITLSAVQETDIDAVVEKMRIDQATLAPKQGANAALVEAGDVVAVQAPGEDRLREWQVSTSDPTEALIGHRVGEHVALPTDKRLSVQIESVKVLEKPDLLELAKVSGHDTIEALRGKIRQELEAGRAQRRERELKLKLLDKIVEQTPFELPGRFVDGLVAQELELFQKRGLPEPSADDVKKLKAAIEQRVRRELVLETLKKQEHLSLNEQDFAQLIEAEAQKRAMSPVKLRALLEREGRLESFRCEHEDERVLQFLYERAKVVPSRPGSKPATSGLV